MVEGVWYVALRKFERNHMTFIDVIVSSSPSAHSLLPLPQESKNRIPFGEIYTWALLKVEYGALLWMNIFSIGNNIHRFKNGKYGMQPLIKIRFSLFLLGQDLRCCWLRWIFIIHCASVYFSCSVKQVHSVLVRIIRCCCTKLVDVAVVDDEEVRVIWVLLIRPWHGGYSGWRGWFRSN